jgi:rod shape-determining protein MreD
MIRYFALPILLFAALLQAVAVPELRIGDAGPDLVLLVALSWTLLAGPREGLAWAVIGGCLQDLLDGRTLGLTALALVLACIAVNLVFGQVGRGNLPAPLLSAAGGALVYHAALYALFTVTRQPLNALLYTLLNITLPGVFFNVLFMLPTFWLLGRVHRRTLPTRTGLG